MRGLTIRLARAYGFCQGVERAVELALAAAREKEAAPGSGRRAGGKPASRLFVTGEIIHNPSINVRLGNAGIVMLDPPGTAGRLAGILPSDRVIIPAFGIDLEEFEKLRSIGCEVIDTTCGWVRRVWKASAEFTQAGFTIVIHGRAEHEETRATASRVRGPWIIVKDTGEAAALGTAIRERGFRAAGEWRGRASAGFDPGRDLERIGLVNQTTMLEQETREIARILREAIRRRDGARPSEDRFRALDTFCTATQRRQEAVRALIAEEDLQCLIVVGGFRSSNTAHLAGLGAEGVPTYHVEDASCLESDAVVRHRPLGKERPVRTRGWLPRVPRVIGVTAGASTPDEETGRILKRLAEIHEATESATSGREPPAAGDDSKGPH
ncbi:MAG: 4-hydroxy-3-methylbut-2-enyl diphosphate reductase [Candidatus Eisenbacteria bacterium]|nr:4-hydroxy-3-methylbut-2-enyl diphosphate reductase [Candidatus Eisenbacteria bacterium]